MTPRWGLKLQERRRLSIKIPPLRGSIRLKGHRPAFQEIAHKVVAHVSESNLSIKGLNGIGSDS